jgi:DNA-directed RNA polymerase subunit RPC12/RpoP
MLRPQNRSFFNRYGKTSIMAWASSFKKVADPKPPTEGVICARCGAAIVVDTSRKFSAEFSVACPKCARRDFYTERSLHPLTVQ